MIKSDNWLYEHGHEIFSPFNKEQVNPASYDLKLDNRYIDLYTGKESVGDSINLRPATELNRGTAVLASTWEYIKLPDNVAGAVYLKSSLARLGLDHALAGWVDPGFEGNLTLELHAHREILLEAGQRVIQIVLYDTDQPALNPYSGKYKGQQGPTKAK